MKLKTVRIRRFQNILDSTEVKIEDKVTCLVGKNESGKDIPTEIGAVRLLCT